MRTTRPTARRGSRTNQGPLGGGVNPFLPISSGIPHIGSLQAQRAIQTRWWHHSQVLQGQSNSGLSSERRITNRLGFNKNSMNPACGGRAGTRTSIPARADLEALIPHLLPHPAPVAQVNAPR